MRRSYEAMDADSLYIEAEAEICPWCNRDLVICEHRIRFVHRADSVYRVVRQLKWCPKEGCPGYHKTYAPFVDLRLALPRATYGTDILLELGERHLRGKESLSAIGRDMNERSIPISQRHTCEVFRSFVALTKAARGDDEQVRERLREQGGIVLMFDGVQYDSTSPVLYIAWDALSGEVLFGERKPFRAENDLIPFLERAKAMDVPIIAIVSDKERGLVPAIAKVFPETPHQLCQIHFLKNCARGMAGDLRELGESVSARAEKVRKIAKSLHEKGWDSVESEQWTATASADEGGEDSCDEAPTKPHDCKESDEVIEATNTPLAEEQLAAELCAMGRHASRATGRAPLNPPESVRHQRLEDVREAVEDSLKKKVPSRS